jgi:hypothetical protein
MTAELRQSVVRLLSSFLHERLYTIFICAHKQVLSECGFTCSAGIAVNKMLAKLTIHVFCRHRRQQDACKTHERYEQT